MSDELTPLQQDELDAMTGDRQAVLRVVGGLRRYRALFKQLEARSYNNGFTELRHTDDDVESIEGVEP